MSNGLYKFKLSPHGLSSIDNMGPNLISANRAIGFLSLLLAAGVALAVPFESSRDRGRHPPIGVSYLGFDRNEYPGDDKLAGLRQTFSFSGYWLNIPPGEKSNSWVGKRRVIQDVGFGFVVLFNGRQYADIKASGDAAKLGDSDAALAVSSVRREGFPSKTIIFLDQEQGGRLLPEQRSYLLSWSDGVISGGFRAGVYCSGIAVKESSGNTIVTAIDIRDHAGSRELHYWVANDSCPPSPGCAFPGKVSSPMASGISFAEVWQYAQSPRRLEFTKRCQSNYATDGNCYPPAGDHAQQLHVDLNVATSSDPSHARKKD